MFTATSRGFIAVAVLLFIGVAVGRHSINKWRSSAFARVERENNTKARLIADAFVDGILAGNEITDRNSSEYQVSRHSRSDSGVLIFYFFHDSYLRRKQIANVDELTPMSGGFPDYLEVRVQLESFQVVSYYAEFE
ncbi:MAG TPA: hypothetical protein DDW52_20860 [Planctomycetaceae bacterium]|nr:hypothetical protein [Planctomycetaceae bacterium]